MFMPSRLVQKGGRRPPMRTDSNDFSDLIRKQGFTKSDRSMTRSNTSDHTSLESKGSYDNDNPFEVTYHHSFHVSDTWDPFGSEDPAAAAQHLEEIKERRGNLRPTKSGGLLQTSSKDTISRLRTGANVRKSSNNMSSSIGAIDFTPDNNEFQSEREKQRRADYKKSIAAAAMAGRRRSSNAPKPSQRQARTVRSSFDESVKQLEGALQRAR